MNGPISRGIGGLGGCPFAEGSGANLATETLVRHLKAWGVKCDIDENKLTKAIQIAQHIKGGEHVFN